MKKKYIVVLFIFIVVSSMLGASVLQLGPSYTIDMPIDKESSTPVDFENIDFSNFKLGADLRVNISYLTLEESIRTTFSDQLVLDGFNLSTTVAFKVKIFFMDFLLGAGLRTDAVKSDNNWYFNGLLNGSVSDVIMSSTLFYKGSLDINLGDRITLFFSLLMPTAETINSLSETRTISVLDVLSPSLMESEATLGVLFKLF